MGVFDGFRTDEEPLVSRQELEKFIDGNEDLKLYQQFPQGLEHEKLT